MTELLMKIYDDVLVYEQDVVKINIQADKEVSELIEPYARKLNADDYNKLDELISETMYIAEHAGFENGVRLTLKLLHSLLK